MDKDERYKGSCPRHGEKLIKHQWVGDEPMYVCPVEKCGHKENEDGEVV